MEWLLFTSQLPVSPSSLRVMVWRRMKAAGALGLQNGVWILPRSGEQERFIQELLAYVREQNGNAQSFIASPLDPSLDAELLQRFQAQRAEEYSELIERCQEMLAELLKETQNQKFSFAELEENEQEFKKLQDWLVRIDARNPMKGEPAEEARRKVEACRAALQEFTRQVYDRDGLAPADPGESGEA